MHSNEREFVFEIKEIVDTFDPDAPFEKKSSVHTITGTARINGDELTVYIDDDKQSFDTFKADDKILNRVTRKIHKLTKKN